MPRCRRPCSNPADGTELRLAHPHPRRRGLRASLIGNGAGKVAVQRLWPHGDDGVCSMHRCDAHDEAARPSDARSPTRASTSWTPGPAHSAGRAGEIHIGGVQVARGYLNRPSSAPSASWPIVLGQGWGADVQDRRPRRWLPEATSSSSAHDHQVKIRGFRIELGEIEARLASFPACAKPSCWPARTCRRQAPGGLPGRAWTPRPRAGPARALGASLPEYMVPAAYVASRPCR